MMLVAIPGDKARAGTADYSCAACPAQRIDAANGRHRVVGLRSAVPR
jgi:hypothetical protein